jgi:hypothetical protein
MALKASRATQIVEARDALAGAYYRRNPQRGHAAAVRRATVAVGPDAARVVAEAEQRLAAKRAKVAKRAVREAAIAAAVRETLTAAQAPKPSPGAGAAPAPAAPDGAGLLDTLAAGRESPFWQPAAPSSGPADGAPAEPADGLHTLGPDELRDYAKGVLAADARARGFGSPIWAGPTDD